MTELDPAEADWVLRHADGERIVGAVGLRAGGAPWLLTIEHDKHDKHDEPVRSMAVLRVGDESDAVAVERAAMIWADAHGLPVPVVLSDDDRSEPLLLIQPISGSSVVPVEPSTSRLETLGALAARIHAVPPPELPRRLTSVNGVDFPPLWDSSRHPLIDRARRAIAMFEPDPRQDGFVHGDLWAGNVLWRDDALIAVLDWDCAGRGPAGVDLGSTRCDAATAYGDHAEDHVLRGWEGEAGHPARDLARWDVVAALCTPPDMGWFTTAIQQQGRPELTRGLLVERRDAFLTRALEELES